MGAAHFEEARYAVSRFSFVLLDLTTLIGSAIDQRRYATLIGSAPVASLHRGALMLLQTLDRSFPTVGRQSVEADHAWLQSQSYAAATGSLACAGVAIQPDGVDRYTATRADWEPLVRRVAPTLGYTADEVDRRRLQA